MGFVGSVEVDDNDTVLDVFDERADDVESTKFDGDIDVVVEELDKLSVDSDENVFVNSVVKTFGTPAGDVTNLAVETFLSRIEAIVLFCNDRKVVSVKPEGLFLFPGN